ncbi:nucleoside deaminase [Streptomyces sp. NPDC097619]|uniref:nucleoside deaminase n=1 Tax=Streptomyces sp. NPDC097619 TaxID=3157228 RepID=UPI00331EA4D3
MTSDERAAAEFDTAWGAAPEAVRRALTLAYASLRVGGLAVGAVLTDPAGTVLAEGRNEAYEEGPGSGPLTGTPLAHAELNALGAARTGWDLGTAVLWSTHEPCPMCAAASRFTGVGQVRYLAPDPWGLSAGVTGSAGAGAPTAGDHWLLAANVMFLRSVALAHADEPGEPRILAHHRTVEPETTELHGAVAPGRPAPDTPEAWFTGFWPTLDAAARARRHRLRATGAPPASSTA